MHVIVIYSVPTSYRRQTKSLKADLDTEVSAVSVARALRSLGHKTTVMPITRSQIPAFRPDRNSVYFNLIEWTGKDLPLAISVFRRLESGSARHTGSGARVYQRTTDKRLMKKDLVAGGFTTPGWCIVTDPVTGSCADKLRYPLFVKIVTEHGGVGLDKFSLVSRPVNLMPVIKKKYRLYGIPLLIEEYITGREFEVSLLEVDKKVRVLPVVENVYDASSPLKFLSFSGRWDEGQSEVSCQYEKAKLTGTKNREITNLALRIYNKLGFSGYARLDIRMDDKGVFYIIEANSNPGLEGSPTENGFIHAAGLAGYTFTETVKHILCAAL